jgi:hypothetical protein
MRTLATLLFAASLVGMWVGNAHAQHVRGTVYQSDTRVPVAGALVILIDEAGRQRVTVLTTESGGFIMNAGAPGRYALRVERIGFRNVFTPHFDLAAGQTVEQEVLASPQAIVLEGITAEARRRCVLRPQEGLAVATLWDEARKALAAAAYTEREAMYRFSMSRWVRELDAASLRVLNESTNFRAGYADGSPFVSVPAEKLLRDGFVFMSDTASYYYAPDAHVLLSNGFLDEYCFRVAEQNDPTSELIGLTFEPASRRGPPAVHGTLWLDRTTFQLRHLEYGYTRVSMPEGPSGRLGGRVEFEPLPNGTWIVRRWYIRMPRIENRATPWRAAGQRVTPTIVALLEEGGEVTQVTQPDNPLLRIRSAQRATLAGTVYDSASALPLAGAVVQVVGTTHTATADALGHYVVHDLPDGEYSVTFTHPRTALYGIEPRALPVSVTGTRSMSLDLAIPVSARTSGLFALCADDAAPVRGATGLLRGTVLDEFTRTPVPGARITLTWRDADPAVSASRSAVAGTDGAFIICGVPEGGTFAAAVALGERRTEHAAVDGPGSAGFAERELTLRVTQPQPVVVFVQDYESGRPIADAAVSMPGLQLGGVTNRQGRVAFADVPPGTHDIRVEHIAYGAHSREISIGTAPETLELRVPAQAIALQGIQVTARSVLAEARRTRGVRVNVVDRDEIARLEHASEHVGHLAQRIAGLQVEETYHGEGGLRNGICVRVPRGTTSGPCAVVVLDGIPLADTAILLALRPDAIESVEFLNAVEAGPRYGTVAGQSGALIIWTRGNGPYVKRGGSPPSP